MKRQHASLSVLIALGLSLSCLTPSQAHADIFAVWLKPKAGTINGTGDVFQRFQGSPAYGVEAGIEIINISLWGDYNAMSQDQYIASGNLGMDFDFELVDHLVLTVGGYGGMVFFGLPSTPSASSASALEASKSEIQGIIGADQYGAFESKYNELAALEAVASDMTFGGNLRARASLEYKILPFISLGIEGMFGWHYLTTGDDLASDVKSRAVDAFIDDKTQGLPQDQVDLINGQRAELKEALGAEEVDLSEGKGTHYNVGAFLNIRF